jgi:hypothetical protein
MNFKNSFYHSITKHSISLISSLNNVRVLVLFFTLVLLFLPLFNLPSILNYNYAHGSISLGQSIQQFQNNLQASINEELQSALDNNSYSNNYYSDSSCEGGENDNNISIQSQTNNNGKTSSTILNMCGNNTNFFSSFSTPSTTIENVNLKGKIVSSEYNVETGVIVNSIFGNWSLVTTTTDKAGEIKFNSSFIKQPLFFNLTTNSDLSRDVNNDTTLYNLSNFRINSIQQINLDKTYQGKIDLVKETINEDIGRTVNSSTFKDIGVSISIFDDQMLTIQFDNQSKLSEEFKNIPLVGIVQ